MAAVAARRPLPVLHPPLRREVRRLGDVEPRVEARMVAHRERYHYLALLLHYLKGNQRGASSQLNFSAVVLVLRRIPFLRTGYRVTVLFEESFADIVLLVRVCMAEKNHYRGGVNPWVQASVHVLF